MTTTLYDQLERRILLLDGGFGTMVQGYGLQEEDYRGRRFAGWPVQLKGCNDLLALTRPDVVREIHEKYLRAGADIIETDSFNANAVSLADYGLEAYAYEMSRAAAAAARSAAGEVGGPQDVAALVQKRSDLGLAEGVVAQCHHVRTGGQQILRLGPGQAAAGDILAVDHGEGDVLLPLEGAQLLLQQLQARLAGHVAQR